MSPAFEALLLAAGRAPSGDNTQPWRFVVDERAGTVALVLDPSRDPSPMNAGQRMARIGVGAALESLLRAAPAFGWEADVEPGRDGALAVVRLRGEGHEGAVDPLLGRRVTNRRAYDASPISPELLDRLRATTPTLDGVATHWIVDHQRLSALAELIGRADAMMFGNPAMRNAFLKNVRFDAPPDAEVDEGLSIASLEVSGADRQALKLMRGLPDWLLRLGGATRVFARKANEAVLSASGLCIVSAPDGSDGADLLVGRAMQRAWLALTAENLAAQPMMSLPVLENAREHGDASLQGALGLAKLEALRDDARSLLPELGKGRLAWLQRFGRAASPSGRTGRLPISAIASELPAGEGPA